MTGLGNITSKGLRETGRVIPGPGGKAFTEVSRFTKKVSDEGKRIRRKAGITTKQPKMLEPVKPDPVPTFQEIQPMAKKRKSGRSSTILASRLNQRRNVLDFNSISTGKTLLK